MSSNLPFVESVDPSGGPAEGNTAVTITGSGFVDVQAVYFGSQVTYEFTVDGETQITVLSPPLSISGSATVSVIVYTQAGSSATTDQTQFTYRSEPSTARWAPPAGISSIKVWLNAFIPRDIPGVTEVVPSGPYAGMTMLRGPIPGVSDCYLTDQRVFDPDIHASSRMHSEVEISFAGAEPGISMEWHHCDSSVEVDCEDGDQECNQHADTSRMFFSNLQITSPSSFSIELHGAANNGCYTGSPDIDYHGTITANLNTRTIYFDGLVDQFPAFEMYATADGGAGAPLFQTMPLPGKTPWNLPFDANRDQKGSAVV